MFAEISWTSSSSILDLLHRAAKCTFLKCSEPLTDLLKWSQSHFEVVFKFLYTSFAISRWLEVSILCRHQTCCTLAWSLCNIIFVIMTCFHLPFFLDWKNSACFLLKTKWLMKICYFGPASFHQPLCFKKAACWIFLLQKIHQMKAGQNNKYNIKKTSGLVQLWQAIFWDIK